MKLKTPNGKIIFEIEDETIAFIAFISLLIVLACQN